MSLGHGGGIGIVLVDLDDRAGAGDLGNRLRDADIGQLRSQSLAPVRQVVRRSRALRRRVADVDHRATRGPCGVSHCSGRGRVRASRVGTGFRLGLTRAAPPVRQQPRWGCVQLLDFARPGEVPGDDGERSGQTDHRQHHGDERPRREPERSPALGDDDHAGANVSPDTAERPVADGLLDVAPRKACDHDRDGGLEDRADQVEAAPPGACQHHDRPLPQIDSVGADADPAQRLPSQNAAQHAVRVDRGGERRHGCQRQQDETVGIQERGERVRLPDEDENANEAGCAGCIEHLGHARSRAPYGDAAGPDNRQRRAEQQLEGPRICPFIHARGVVARVVHETHRHGRGHCPGERQHHKRAALAHRPDRDQQQPWPHEVELLLDRQ